MIEMSALDTYHFIKTTIPPSPQRVLEIGCGNGYLTLELARDGHTVIGLDISQNILAVAEQTRRAYPEPPGFGTLNYVCADIGTWPLAESSFDVVIFNRTLHHLPALQPILAKIHHILAPHGLLVCQDYAYDRLNIQTASWVYAMQRLLFLSGLSEDNPATAADDISSIEALQTTWFEKAEKREHRLNRYDEMMHALNAAFHQQHISWVPYLFIYIGNSIQPLPQEKEHELITFLRNIEQHLIDTETIQAVGFRSVGTT